MTAIKWQAIKTILSEVIHFAPLGNKKTMPNEHGNYHLIRTKQAVASLSAATTVANRSVINELN